MDDRPLQPLDGRREAPDRKRMLVRSPDGAARSVRAIVSGEARGPPHRFDPIVGRNLGLLFT